METLIATLVGAAMLSCTLPATYTEPIDQHEVSLPQELKRICSCESTGSPNNEPQHFAEDGSVLVGKINHDDIGACQINVNPETTDWLRISKENGWDVWTEDGNKRMAIWIYETYGTQPWNWSRGCWGQGELDE